MISLGWFISVGMQWLSANWIEAAGVLTTVVGIWLTTRRNIACWPVVLVADVLYLWIFYRAHLFSDSLLQIFFITFTLYGWWHWSRGLNGEAVVRVVPLPMRHITAGLFVGAFAGLLLGVVMTHLHAALPYVDAELASYSLVATWWQARKHTANWILWIFVNLCYIGEYVYKSLPLTAALYAGLVVLAAVGLRQWRRAMNRQIASKQAG